MQFTIKRPMILDFDIENRPLSYLGMDFTTSEITAIGFGWADQEEVQCVTLKHEDMEDDWTYSEAMIELLEHFRTCYDMADIVTGHFIRNHDLPIINASLIELGRPPLAPKMTICTKNDLIKFKGISKSQESLGNMLNHTIVPTLNYLASKEHMNQDAWRRANRLTEEGVQETERRVVGDVKQHKQLRLALVKAGLLRSPKVWRP
jgi:hypothetical protein